MRGQLSLFPEPMPDEPFYSLAARYHALVGYESFRSTAQDLFGISHVSHSIDLPNRLQAFSNRVRWLNWHKDRLIDNHTAAPYYMALLDHSQRKGLRAVMMAPAPPTPVAFLGLGAAKVMSPAALRYCPECVDHDRASVGFAYWRRLHQLPGVVVCPHHGCVLCDSPILRGTRRCRYELATLDQVAVDSSHLPSGRSDRLVDLARDSESLLLDGCSNLDPDRLRQSILSLFISKGWATTRGMVRSEPIRDAWRSRFPSEVRGQINFGLADLSDPIPFLRALVKPVRRKVHPLIAIMLAQTADGNMESVLHAARIRLRKTQARPAVDRPPCINLVCLAKHCEEPSATSLRHEGSTIEVHCTRCGLRYRAPTVGSTRRKVLEWGWLWDKRLTELVSRGIESQRAIARQLGVDPKTIRRAASRLGLSVPWASLGKPQDESGSAHILAEKRGQWAALRSEHPSVERSELRRIEPALWAWLYRNDRRWLFKQSPAPKPRRVPNERVNWAARDSQLALDLLDQARSILEAPGRPVQITQSELARRSGRMSLLSKRFRDRLPLAAATAEKLAESREAFARRRIGWAASQCLEDGRAPLSWDLARSAGLREDLALQLRGELDSAAAEVAEKISLAAQQGNLSIVAR